MKDGNVFISSGEVKGDNYYTEVCEIYNPVTNSWNYAGSLTQYHPQHSSYQLSDSTILIVGGENYNWEIFNLNQLRSIYVFEDTSEPFWMMQSIVKLSNNKIIKIGGMVWEDAVVFPTDKCEIFDPNITSVENNSLSKINNYQLFQNFPNPFNPSTTLSYSLPSASNVKLVIYDVMGRMIKSFITNSQSSGNHKVVWNGTNSNGVRVATGIYIYRFEATSLETNEHFVKSEKLMLVK